MTAATSTSMGPASSPWCQRWRNHQAQWRHVAEPHRFDPTRYLVDPVDELQARAFCAVQHYLGASWPAAIHRFGLWDRHDGRLVGVAVYAAPVHAGVLTNVFPQLDAYRASVELARFVLLDEVPANAETWTLARTFRQLLDRGVRGVVSFADPMPRPTSTGVIMPGHRGVIYMASNAIYTGRGTPRTLILLPDKTILNGRTAQKIRRGEPGHHAAEHRLVTLGAPARTLGQDPRIWLRDALNVIGATRVRHHGPHRFAFPLGKNRRDRDRITIGVPAAPYPRHHDQLSAQVGFATTTETLP